MELSQESRAAERFVRLIAPTHPIPHGNGSPTVFTVPHAYRKHTKERPRSPLEPQTFQVNGVTVRIDREKSFRDSLNRRLVRIHPMDKDHLDYISRMLLLPDAEKSFGYHMEVNFDLHRNVDLVNAFAYWLRDEAKKKRKVAVRGKASSPRWHRLKQLAAKRLSDAGLNYKDAQQKIAEREKVALLPKDFNRVLPKYNSAGAWHDAVKEANLFVETMKKNFHYEDWELL